MLLVSFMLVAQKIIFRVVFTSVPINLVLVVVHQRYFNIILIHLQANQSQLTLHPPRPPRLSHFIILAENNKREKRETFMNTWSSKLDFFWTKTQIKLQFHQNDPLFFLYITR